MVQHNRKLFRWMADDESALHFGSILFRFFLLILFFDLTPIIEGIGRSRNECNLNVMESVRYMMLVRIICEIYLHSFLPFFGSSRERSMNIFVCTYKQ